MKKISILMDKDILKAIKGIYLGLLVGLLIIVWGWHDKSNFKLILGLLIIVIAIKTAVNDYATEQSIKSWIERNEDRLLLFYPTKKLIQDRIRELIIPIFEEPVLEAYYEGPKIGGDLKSYPYLLKRIMKEKEKIQLNCPSLIRIKSGEFVVVQELEELMKINETDFDIGMVKQKIRDACA